MLYAQFIEQEPGPRGSPQEPQPPAPDISAKAAEPGDEAVPLLATAKVESCRAASSLPHRGQRAPPSPNESFS